MWPIRCDCGWAALIVVKDRSRAEIEEAVEAKYREHLPPDERELYVLVDQRPGHEGNWLMPVGSPAIIRAWFESEGEYRAHLIGTPRIFPIGEIRIADGRVFKIE